MQCNVEVSYKNTDKNNFDSVHYSLWQSLVTDEWKRNGNGLDKMKHPDLDTIGQADGTPFLNLLDLSEDPASASDLNTLLCHVMSC